MSQGQIRVRVVGFIFQVTLLTPFYNISCQLTKVLHPKIMLCSFVVDCGGGKCHHYGAKG